MTSQINKQAIITGGAIRVGRSICTALAGAGYDIICIYNKSEESAKSLQDELSSKNQISHIYKCDISNILSLTSTLESIFNTHNNIQLVVNNASIFEKHTFQKTTEQIFDAHHSINYKAPFFISQLYAQYVTQNQIQNANIININDSYTTTNSGAYFAYLLSKKSLQNLTDMLAKDLAPNIRVNQISIGHLLASEYWSQEMINKTAQNFPLQSAADLKSITDAINYLSTAKFTTGQNIFVDSGHHLM